MFVKISPLLQGGEELKHETLLQREYGYFMKQCVRKTGQQAGKLSKSIIKFNIFALQTSRTQLEANNVAGMGVGREGRVSKVLHGHQTNVPLSGNFIIYIVQTVSINLTQILRRCSPTFPRSKRSIPCYRSPTTVNNALLMPSG